MKIIRKLFFFYYVRGGTHETNLKLDRLVYLDQYDNIDLYEKYHGYYFENIDFFPK